MLLSCKEGISRQDSEKTAEFFRPVFDMRQEHEACHPKHTAVVLIFPSSICYTKERIR
jgi:hypothetical protein